MRRSTEGTTIPNEAEPDGVEFEDWYGNWHGMIASLEDFTKETSSKCYHKLVRFRMIENLR